MIEIQINLGVDLRFRKLPVKRWRSDAIRIAKYALGHGWDVDAISELENLLTIEQIYEDLYRLNDREPDQSDIDRVNRRIFSCGRQLYTELNKAMRKALKCTTK